ncbi:cytochrome d ubiquinol oxidase subunit II [Pseudolysinimonas sp.]|uniref:cytochrome d ubiquinol oxidase subunit II n=1 Tax=Pseudolysinimonas sp. TaxID=2680009 RepID=UPI003F803C48
MELQTVWFVVIAVLWIAYLLLEGFDLGVGMHMLVTARDDRERRLMLNTIGPVWDGNEVWLITAGAATFAAFPDWYAALFSGLYLPLLVVLVGLIVRAVAIEYRGKVAHQRWARVWDAGIGVGSLVVAFGVGAALALTTTGLPLDAQGDRVGGPFAWFTPMAVVGGLAVVGFCLVHGATFLALKTDGPVRVRTGRRAALWAPIALIPLAVWAVVVQLRDGSAVTWGLTIVAVGLAVLGALAAHRRREGIAFVGIAGFAVAGAAGIFAAVYPVVLPSTVSASFDLTIATASSGPYTLGIMTIITACALPVILGYQAWSYWVFRRRLRVEQLPAAHAFAAAVRR